MARRGRRSSGRYYSRTAYGYERAREHISQAAQLSKLLGGTDKDVKEYFFSLPPEKLGRVLNDYERRFGASARAYAEKTFFKWKSRQTQMSGMVAERLFQLLPLHMPLSDKYKLIENLWRHYGPSSKKIMLVGMDAEPDVIASTAQEYLSSVIKESTIPSEVEDRFRWIAAGDVKVRQQILNRLLDAERLLATESIRAQMPMLLNHMHGDQEMLTGQVTQVVKAGKHELQISVHRRHKGVSLVDRMPYPQSSGNVGCLVILIIIVIAWWVLSHH